MLSADRLSSHAWRLDTANVLGKFKEEPDLRGFYGFISGR
jgi:hypothetical protein